MISSVFPDTKFNIRHNKNGIFIQSDNLDFLRQKWKLIEEYTKKVDPKAPLRDFEIIEYKTKKHPFNHYIAIRNILPRPFRYQYGKDRYINKEANCHQAAYVAAGVTPIMRSSSNGVFSKKVHKVAMEELSCGDNVFLPSRGGHSLVYLDDDLCISMNGWRAPYEIQKTSDVLKLYGHSEDVLSSKSVSEGIQISRKNLDWSYPEPFMPLLLEYYEFAEYLFDFQLPSDPKANRLCEIYKEIKDLSEKDELDDETRVVYQELYRDARSLVPRYVIDRIEPSDR